MAIGISHVLQEHRRREAYTSVLIDWLNNTPSKAARARVVEIIELFRKIDQFGRLDLPPVRLGRWSKLRPTKLQAENAARLGLWTKSLGSVLELYKFSPERRPKPGGGWAIGWKHSNRAGALDIVVSREGDTLRITEGDAVLRVFRIIEGGYFQRLRKCDFCAKWFFARFGHQHYCGKKCQMTAYKTTEEWREHRRSYMQELRKLKASGKVRRWHPRDR